MRIQWKYCTKLVHCNSDKRYELFKIICVMAEKNQSARSNETVTVSYRSLFKKSWALFFRFSYFVLGICVMYLIKKKEWFVRGLEIQLIFQFTIKGSQIEHLLLFSVANYVFYMCVCFFLFYCEWMSFFSISISISIYSLRHIDKFLSHRCIFNLLNRILPGHNYKFSVRTIFID